MPKKFDEITLAGGGRTAVTRKGDVVYRAAGAWSPSVHSLLRHLEQVGFEAAPRVIGSGFDVQGRETLSFIEGEFVHPAPWSDAAIIAVGTLLKRLHQATKNFTPAPMAQWRPWFGRQLRRSQLVYGHGDFTPWNLVSKNGLPIAAIDWENAGPIDPLVELAHVCWLNVQLVDDDVAERAQLAPIAQRAKQLKLLVDAYELPKQERAELLQVILEVAVCDAADQAIEGNITPETNDVTQLWGLAWRTRSAAWMIKNRTIISNALSKV